MTFSEFYTGIGTGIAVLVGAILPMLINIVWGVNLIVSMLIAASVVILLTTLCTVIILRTQK